ncbi:NAD(P)/FAD-dependent oxidoreductase [Salipiger mucosus]|uniref:D-amino acid dehydrogenase small subunit n=1 Tax=Salipiger mucosus DSM 16094 TaxID=1123237 RepID=S9S482_9RHOB|nr:FAD-dependent oxidoreductase [Salipiger mucosus]EPX84990.1 D-amino acid dehydrogenase small subunit [Salipiger mucosus DSM 16094]
MIFPFRGDDPPEHAGDLPEACDLVVIGGGVIGTCTALYAARAGLRVALLEKGRIAAEQSSRNWGWIRVQGRDMAEIPIALEAQDLWTALDADCGGRLGVRTVGVSYLARSEREMAGFDGWLQEAKPLGVSSRLLDADETNALVGAENSPWTGALHTPTDMKGEPWVAVPELARLAASEGAVVREDCAVRGLDLEAGQVRGVVTEHGRIRADRVVLAGGAWSSLLLRRHGIDIPQLSVRSTAMATEALPQAVNTAAVDDGLAFRPRADGGYTLAPAGFAELFVGPDSVRHLSRYLPLAISGDFDVHLRRPAPAGYPDAWGTPRRWDDAEESPFERVRILSPEPNAAKVIEMRTRFGGHFPQMGKVPLQAFWAGMIDVLPDVVPVVGPVQQLPGLTVATGMCGHGFGIGPAFGRIMADLAQERDLGHDLHRFRITRFSDGSRLVPGPNI